MATVVLAGSGKTLTGGLTMKSGASLNKNAKTVPDGKPAVAGNTPQRRLISKSGKGAGAVSAMNRAAALRDKIKAKYGNK